MKIIKYFFVALVLVSSCKEDEKVDTSPVYAKNYGSGMYVVTDNGITFIKDGEQKSQIYNTVNGTSISMPKKIKFSGSKAYIVSDDIKVVDAETFQNLGVIGGFTALSDLTAVSHDRLFALDKGDAKLKVVDVNKLEITTDIETGDSTRPSFIINYWYRCFALNGGAVADSLNDSTIVAVDYKDVAVPLADFMGKIIVGDNPNTAVWNGNLKVLCQGIYDADNPSGNTEASFYNIDPWNMEVDGSEILNGVYNARNLVKIPSSVRYYFTSENGIYWILDNSSTVNPIVNIKSDVLYLRNETYAINDTTNAQSGMLYFNDVDNAPNTIYKFNIATLAYADTMIVDGPVRYINFY